MPHPFDDIRQKLWRAYQHTKAVSEAAHEFYESDFYTRGSQTDREGRFVLRVVDFEAAPPRIGVLVGDAVHQLRSSLDHLMWILANPSSDEEEQVQFPIVHCRAAFYGRKKGPWGRGYRGTRHMMPGVPRGVRTLVERLQPYHSRKWPETALLGYVRDISNRDKHRSLAPTAASIENTNPKIRLVGDVTVIGVENFTPVFKPGAILTRLTVRYGDLNAEVYVKPVLSLIPVFDRGAPKPVRGRPVVSTLASAGEFIEETLLPMFERFV